MENGQPGFPIEYVEDSLTIHAAKAIDYEHEQVRYLYDGDVVRLDWSDFEF